MANTQVTPSHYIRSRSVRYNFEEDARAWIDLLKAKTKDGPGYRSSGRVKSCSWRGSFPLALLVEWHTAHTHTAIVEHSNHFPSATTCTTIAAYSNDAGVLDGLLRALDSHDPRCFVFGRLMGLVDALGSDSLPAENTGNQNISGAATESAETTPPPPDGTATPCSQLKKLNACLTALLLFSGNSNPRSIMSTPAARLEKYQGKISDTGIRSALGQRGALEHGWRLSTDWSVVRRGQGVGNF